jgi:hypothetical protein
MTDDAARPRLNRRSYVIGLANGQFGARLIGRVTGRYLHHEPEQPGEANRSPSLLMQTPLIDEGGYSPKMVRV